MTLLSYEKELAYILEEIKFHQILHGNSRYLSNACSVVSRMLGDCQKEEQALNDEIARVEAARVAAAD